MHPNMLKYHLIDVLFMHKQYISFLSLSFDVTAIMTLSHLIDTSPQGPASDDDWHRANTARDLVWSSLATKNGRSRRIFP